MPSLSSKRTAAMALLCFWPVAFAQAPEPAVQHVQLEDDNVKIEELRVRGLTQRMVVRPKIEGVRAYEIQPPDPARDSTAARGSSGRRVWRVLSF